VSTYVLPTNIKKTIRFPRLSSKNVLGYEIYTKTIDATYDSGIRTELIDTIPNPIIPSPVREELELEYSNNATWNLPKNIYMDKDHEVIILVDGIQISKLHYTINKTSKVFTINTNKVKIEINTKVKIIYYKDVIEKSYTLENDCEFFINPIIIESYQYGMHNVIL